MDNECFCCFIEIDESDSHRIEASWRFPDSQIRIVTDALVVCTVCRRLDCDVLNPEGCKRPESKA